MDHQFSPAVPGLALDLGPMEGREGMESRSIWHGRARIRAPPTAQAVTATTAVVKNDTTMLGS
jgi:hypothetical protein